MFTLGILLAIFFWKAFSRMYTKARVRNTQIYGNYLYQILVAAIRDALGINNNNSKRIHSRG